MQNETERAERKRSESDRCSAVSKESYIEQDDNPFKKVQNKIKQEINKSKTYIISKERDEESPSHKLKQKLNDIKIEIFNHNSIINDGKFAANSHFNY